MVFIQSFWKLSTRTEQKPKFGFQISALRKNWRQPTLAEPIGLLPSARLCLTAEFGMGSGRTTALWPPKTEDRRKEKEEWRKNSVHSSPGLLSNVKERFTEGPA